MLDPLIDYNVGIEKSLNFIRQNYSEFSLVTGSADDKLRKLKPFAELLLTVTVLNRYNFRNKEIDYLRNWLWQETREGNELLGLLIIRPDLIILTGIYADFVELGFENKKLHKFLSYLFSISPTINNEHPAWVNFSIEYNFNRLKINPNINVGLIDSWPIKLLPPWMLNTEQAYTLTHKVFYITDFGFKKEKLENEINKYIKKWLPAWIGIFAQQNDFDLTAEFLMVSECIGNIELSDNFYSLLLQNQHPKGFFWSPKKTDSSLIIDSDSVERKELLTNYHATLVSILALAMRIRRSAKV